MGFKMSLFRNLCRSNPFFTFWKEAKAKNTDKEVEADLPIA